MEKVMVVSGEAKTVWIVGDWWQARERLGSSR